MSTLLLLKDNEHIITYKQIDTDLPPFVRYEARTKTGITMMEQAFKYLESLAPYGFVPLPIDYTNGVLITEFIEEQLPTELEDRRELIINSARVLRTLRLLGIKHGDLTRPNIIVSNTKPYIIDWFESSPMGEDKKRPEPDAYHFLRAIKEISGDPSRVLQRWIHMRDYLPDPAEGYFLDLGAYRGDMCYMAASEGFASHAVEIRNDVYEEDEQDVYFHFGHMMREFVYDAIPYFKEQWGEVPAVICMQSAYPYLREQCEHPSEANYIISRCIAQSKVFFFETQLYGDGPGPVFLKTDDDVVKLLKTCANHVDVDKESVTVEKVVTVEVKGRNARRTTFAVS